MPDRVGYPYGVADEVFVGAGDIAGFWTQDEATAKLLDNIVTQFPSAMVFTAGDNAYPNGAAAEFNTYYAPTWGRHKARTRPSPGNHDYNSSGAGPYYSIQAKNLHYGLDFCPAFWEWLIQSNTAKQVFSIERVGDEIEAGDDDLAAWAAKRRPSFFLRPDPTIMPALGTVISWATGQRYEPAAVSTFLQVADYYLAAHALAHGDTLVTHEIASTSTKRIKIPDACIGLGVKCMTPYEMLRFEGARFILGPRPA